MVERAPKLDTQMIPASGGRVTTLRTHAVLAGITGLALRILIVLQFPVFPDDGKTYLQLALNWIDHHVYGLWLGGQLIPTDLRMPGYPAFLAGVSMLRGRSQQAISLSQAVVDLSTCFLTAGLAAALAPKWARYRIIVATLWLSATCPFVANYAAAILTEVPVACLSTVASLCFVLALRPARAFNVRSWRFAPTPGKLLIAGALFTGLATLLRPEMPLLLAVAGVLYCLRWWDFTGWRSVVLTGATALLVFVLPLLPWATRNYVTLHKVQFLAPRYVTLPDEYAPVGYYAWLNTWMERYRDIYFSTWTLSVAKMNIDDLPPSAFDSAEEKTRVAALIDEYNNTPLLDITPEVDQQFAEIGRERTRRHPLRTYISVPFQRVLTIWFTPRTELLPIDGKLWPIAQYWEDSPGGWLTTAGLALLGYLYVLLSIGGSWVAWRSSRSGDLPADAQDNWNLWGIASLIVYMLVRSAFLTTLEAPEPRYVVTCYPAVLALAGLLWAQQRRTLRFEHD